MHDINKVWSSVQNLLGYVDSCFIMVISEISAHMKIVPKQDHMEAFGKENWGVFTVYINFLSK